MNKENAIYAIIVAGGNGNRMNSDIPKQFMLLNGKPIIFHTIEKFITFNSAIKIIIVLSESHIDYFKSLVKKYNLEYKIQIAYGGKTRFHSVRNGLDIIKDDGIVLIHDAVRPLVSINTIERCYFNAINYGNAIPAVPIVNSLRKINGNRNMAVNRREYVAIQTPQAFLVDKIKSAYNQSYNNNFTDDASVYESIYNDVKIVEGNVENVKITYAYDISIAESILKKNLDR